MFITSGTFVNANLFQVDSTNINTNLPTALPATNTGTGSGSGNYNNYRSPQYHLFPLNYLIYLPRSLNSLHRALIL